MLLFFVFVFHPLVSIINLDSSRCYISFYLQAALGSWAVRMERVGEGFGTDNKPAQLKQFNPTAIGGSAVY